MFPNDQLDEPEALQQVLGSFWNNLYGDRTTVEAYCVAKAEAEKQTLNDLNEAADAVGKDSCPVFHRARWMPYTIRQSQRTQGKLLQYGGDGIYGGQPTTLVVYQYGIAPDNTVAYPLPDNVITIPMIFDGITVASVAMINQIDYQVDSANGKILFYTDPFLQTRLKPRPIYEQIGSDVVLVDEELTLWLFQVDVDVNYLYQQFGYVVGLNMHSSQGYKTILSNVWDALVGGTSKQQVENILAAMAGSPLAADYETVELVTSDNVGLLVITDKNVYRYSGNALPVVAGGDKVIPGQPLSDVFAFYDLNEGKLPPIPALALGQGFLDPEIAGDIIFLNQNLPLQVTTAQDGHTVVQFALGGKASAVARFWSILDARGVASGNTLAHLLDQRTNQVGEPGASNLPATINPLQFVVENVLLYNTVLVVMRGSEFGPDATGLDQGRFLRKIVPPHQVLLILIELTVPTDSITMNGSTYYAENGTVWDATASQNDFVDVSYYGESQIISQYA